MRRRMSSAAVPTGVTAPLGNYECICACTPRVIQQSVPPTHGRNFAKA